MSGKFPERLELGLPAGSEAWQRNLTHLHGWLYRWCFHNSPWLMNTLQHNKQKLSVNMLFTNIFQLSICLLKVNISDYYKYWWVVSTPKNMKVSWDYSSQPDGKKTCSKPPTRIYGSVSKPCAPGEHQSSWDLWMFISLKMVFIGIDPYPYYIILQHILISTRYQWAFHCQLGFPQRVPSG